MNFNLIRSPTDLALLGKQSLYQLRPARGVSIGSLILEDWVLLPSKWYPSEDGDKGFLTVSLAGHLKASAWSVFRKHLRTVLSGDLADARLVFVCEISRKHGSKVLTE